MRRLLLAGVMAASWAAACASPQRVALVETYARAFGLDPDLLVALVWTESRFCPLALSPAGALGLGQLMPETARRLGVDPRDPRQNAWGSAKLLRAAYDRHHSWPLALAAYNAGEGAVRRYGGVPPYPETRHYIRRVLRMYRALRRREGRGGGNHAAR